MDIQEDFRYDLFFQLSSEILSMNFPNYEFEHISILINIFMGLTPDKFIKNLLYLNKCSRIGYFARIFTDKFIKYISQKNVNKLRQLMENPKTPEYDSNNYLSEELLKELREYMDQEITTVNNKIDEYMLSENNRQNILNSCNYYDCVGKICSELSGKIVICENFVSYLFVIFQDDDLFYREILDLWDAIYLCRKEDERIPKNIRSQILHKYRLYSLFVKSTVDHRKNKS